MVVARPGQLNREEPPPIGGSRCIDEFEFLGLLGKGSYGEVSKARDRKTGEIVALKKILMEDETEGFPTTAIREIKILSTLRHENVIRLLGVATFSAKDKYKDVSMVLEYMDRDLNKLVKGQGRLSSSQIKGYMKQLLTGLQYCHDKQVLHRDIKDSNILINNKGTLKIADFGLARVSNQDIIKKGATQKLSDVGTLSYCAPELLLGATSYGPEIDMWSVGCVFARLLNGGPILHGSKTESEQLDKIFQLCGSPDETNWPGVSKLPLYKKNKAVNGSLRDTFKHFDRDALELLEKMLVLDPSKRISAANALADAYFTSGPLPCGSKSLPSDDLKNKNKRKLMPEAEEKNPKKRDLK